MAQNPRADRTDDDEERLSRRASRDSVPLEALASGLTHLEAGALAGCSPRTARRRIADPTFAAELAGRRAQLAVEACGRLGRMQDRALEVFVECMDPAVPAPVRLRAAALVVSAFERVRLGVDVDARLSLQERLVDRLLDRPVGCDDPEDDDNDD